MFEPWPEPMVAGGLGGPSPVHLAGLVGGNEVSGWLRLCPRCLPHVLGSRELTQGHPQQPDSQQPVIQDQDGHPHLLSWAPSLGGGDSLHQPPLGPQETSLSRPGQRSQGTASGSTDPLSSPHPHGIWAWRFPSRHQKQQF